MPPINFFGRRLPRVAKWSRLAFPSTLRLSPCHIYANTVKIRKLLSQSTHTIPSREEILGIFRSAKGPLDLRTLSKTLKVGNEAQAILSRRLTEMMR